MQHDDVRLIWKASKAGHLIRRFIAFGGGKSMTSEKSDFQADACESLQRRAFITTAALVGVTAAIASVPLLSYVITPALKKGTSRWIDFGPVENLKSGEIEMLSYEFMVKDGWQVLPQRGFVWVKHEHPDKIIVFSSTCTHLACNVIWNKEKQIFECPCHTGHFDINGQPISGPPTRPLVAMDNRVEEGKLMVLMPA